MEIKGKIEEKIYCRTCGRKTNNGYLLKHTESYTDHETGFAYSDDYFITKCLGCDTVAFYREYGDTEMLDYNPEGDWGYYIDKYRYPEQPTTSLEVKEVQYEKKEFEKVPDLILDLYNEVVSSFNLKHFLLCAVGLRMIIEGICKELNVTDGFILDEDGQKKTDSNGQDILRGNLEGKINGLQSRGIITTKQSEVLHQVRLLGNVTAHELKVPRKKTVKLGLEIIENVLHNIFDLETFSLL
ncbi:DUF4145 domain-containing protein [Ureibacillus composti]